MKTAGVGGTGLRVGTGRMVVYRLSVLVAAFVGGMFGAVPVAPLGLGVHELVSWPLTLAIGALFAALAAAWIGTLLTPDQTQSRLLAVVGVSELFAIVGVPIPLVGPLFLSRIASLGLSVLIVALGASWATWRYRTARHPLGWDGAIILGGAGIVAIFLGLLNGAGLVPGVPMDLFIGLPFISIMVWTGLGTVAVSALLVRWYAYGERKALRRDAALTLGLVGLAPLIVIGTVYLASVAGLTGA